MFSFLIALASLAASANALAIPRIATREAQIPPTYAQGYLEPYVTYHTRYLALSCQDKHNTSFFEDCCHPMLATENLKDNRKAFCTPSASALSSAAAAEPTSTVIPDAGDDDCPDDAEDSPAADAAPTPAPPKPKSTPAPAAPVNVAPDPPKASSDPKPQPSAPPAPAPKSSSGLSGIIGKIFGNNGSIATFFFQNGVAGACGTVHSDSAHIVALETQLYANGAHCGKEIAVKNLNTGEVHNAVVADECPTCISPDSIDLSEAFFQLFAPTSAGTFLVEWAFTGN